MRTALAVFVILSGCDSADPPPPREDASTAFVDASADSTPDAVTDSVLADGNAAEASGADAAGRACASPVDCGDVSLFLCDPTTKTCRASDCSDKIACPADKTCVRQTAAAAGLCLTSCPTIGATTGCAANEVCTTSPGRLPGHCTPRGASALGEFCTVNPMDTGCAEGICRSGSGTAAGTCVALCDPRGTTNTCPTGKMCSGGFDCALDVSVADPAVFETFCANAEAPCALQAGVQKGVCGRLYTASVPICRQACAEGSTTDCPASFVCVAVTPLVTGGGVGLCMPSNKGDACHDGGSGTCAECVAKETAAGGCCAGPATQCASTECRAMVDRLTRCRRDQSCISSELAANPSLAPSAAPLFLCLSAYGSPLTGACGDVCMGPSVCGQYDGPQTVSTCTTCASTPATCKPNGCFNGFYCDRVEKKCLAPATALAGCDGSDAGTDGG